MARAVKPEVRIGHVIYISQRSKPSRNEVRVSMALNPITSHSLLCSGFDSLDHVSRLKG